MSDSPQPVGSISWTDITVPDAENLRNFYESVVGWKSTPLDMGGYNDFCMNRPTDDNTVAGICHARGDNANLPAQWLIYITVADVEASARQCIALGGKVIAGPRELGGGKMIVIRDPVGAVAGLFQHATA